MTGSDKPFDKKTLTERLDVNFALQAAGLGVWEVNPKTNQVLWDDRCRELFGLAKDNLLPYEEAIHYIHPEDVDRVNQAVAWAMNPESDGFYDQTYRTIGPNDGRLRWVRFWGQAYFTATGELYRFAGIAQEVTQQVLAQQTLEQQQAQQRFMLQFSDSLRSLSDPSAVYNQTACLLGKYLGANRVGYAEDQGDGESTVVLHTYVNGVDDLQGTYQYADYGSLLAEFLAGRTVVRSDIANDPTLTHAEKEAHHVLQVGAALNKPLMKDGRLVAVLFIHYQHAHHWSAEELNLVEMVAERLAMAVDRARAEEALRQSEQQFRLLADSVPQAIWVTDAEGNAEFLNKWWTEYSGVPYKPSTAWQIASDILHPDDGPLLVAAFQQAMQNGTKFEVEQRNRSASGEYRWFLNKGEPYRDPQTGQITKWVGAGVDIHDRKLAEHLLQQSEARFRSLIEEAPVATGLFVGPELRIEVANPILLSYWGKSQDVLGQPFREIAPQLEEQGFFEKLDGVFATGQPYQQLAAPAQVTIDGIQSTYYFDFSFKPLFNTAGDVYAILNTAIDVTDRVLAHQQLQETEATLRGAIALASMGTWTLDMSTGRTTYSERLKELFEFSQDYVDRDQLYNPILEADRPRLDAAVSRAASPTGDGVLDEEYTIVTQQTGRHRIVRAQAQMYFNAQGQAYKMVGTMRDVTEERQTRLALEQLVQQSTKELAAKNEKLQQSQQQLAHFIRMAPVSIALLEGPDFVFIIANERYLDLVGRTQEQLIGKPLSMAMPEVAPVVEPLLQQIQRGLPVYANEVETTITRQGKLQTGYYNFIWEPYYLPDGTFNGLVTVATDVTDQVLARRQIEESHNQYRRLSEQLAASNEELEESNGLLFRSNENLQQFAYVASHDLQEPLRKIQQFGDLLKTRYADSGGESLAYLERMQAAASRMSTLIKDLLAYSRIATQRDASGPVSLQSIVETVLTDLELVIDETGATVEVSDLPTVEGDRSQLEQLFQNLFSNALKFHKPQLAPHIQVQASQVASDNLPPGIKPSRRALTYARIDVQDNGVGFDEKYLDRIFQVFQRLHGKNEFRGTGIGLAICEKVVANHGGAITATSQPGEGATFSVYLPVQ